MQSITAAGGVWGHFPSIDQTFFLLFFLFVIQKAAAAFWKKLVPGPEIFFHTW